MLAEEIAAGGQSGAGGRPVPRTVAITVPGVPVAKGRPRFSTFGGVPRAITPTKTRRYEDLLRLEAGRIMEYQEPLDGALEAAITVYLPIPKSLSKAKRAAAINGLLRPTTRPDLDNFAKVVDSLNGIVFRDDSQIVGLTVEKRYSEAPRLRMIVSELGA